MREAKFDCSIFIRSDPQIVEKARVLSQNENAVQLAGRSYRATFLLGAGASRGAVKHILHKQKRIKPPLNWDFFKVADTYARAEGASSAARHRLDRILRAFRQDLPVKGQPTMEQAFSLLYVAKDFPDIYQRGPGRRPDVGVRREIDDFFRLLFPILTMLDRGSNQETGYDRLARCLSPDDTIITLNYDTMLDSALHRRGWNPKEGYGIPGAPEKFKWSQLALPADQTPLRSKLIKLHGSANWFVRGDTSDLKKIFSSKPTKITKPRENEISGHIRQIAPPIYAKIFEHAHWSGLWASAFDALREAEILVVIGCSLIDTDFHLRALLSQVVRTRKKSGKKFGRIYVVDRVAVRRKWLTVFKGSFVTKKQFLSFEKFLEQELRV